VGGIPHSGRRIDALTPVAELVGGLTGAFAVRAIVQKAIGALLARSDHTPDEAFMALRLRAADLGRTRPEVARQILAEE
jgi:hypothetical protein